MVTLCLIGVRYSKVTDRFIKLATATEITADRRGIARLGMCASEHPAARLGVEEEHIGIERLDHWLDRPSDGELALTGKRA